MSAAAPNEAGASRAPVAGLLLTGGRSSRLGADKALLRLASDEGKTLAQALSERLSEVASPVCEVGPGRTNLPQAEGDPGEGPLTAIVAGWRSLRALGHEGPVLVLATDLPNVSVRLLGWLANRPGEGSVVPVVDGHAQPLCARWAPDDLDRAESVARTGERAARAALGPATSYPDEPTWGPVATPLDFADVDTPEDARRLGLDQSP